MIRVVIDTNVLVSALLFGGKPGKLVSLWKKGKIQPCLSREMVDEHLRVLSYPKFELSENEIEYLIYHEILPYFEMIAVKERPEIVHADRSDDKFLHYAAAARVASIISGDHHLLALKAHARIPILTVDQFLRKVPQ